MLLGTFFFFFPNSKIYFKLLKKLNNLMAGILRNISDMTP